MKNRYLQKLGHSYYVRVRVPPRLQQHFGGTHIRRALHTRDINEANRLKWSVVAQIKNELRVANKTLNRGLGAGSEEDEDSPRRARTLALSGAIDSEAGPIIAGRSAPPG